MFLPPFFYAEEIIMFEWLLLSCLCPRKKGLALSTKLSSSEDQITLEVRIFRQRRVD
jgi:hypothetical protein